MRKTLVVTFQSEDKANGQVMGKFVWVLNWDLILPKDIDRMRETPTGFFYSLGYLVQVCNSDDAGQRFLFILMTKFILGKAVLCIFNWYLLWSEKEFNCFISSSNCIHSKQKEYSPWPLVKLYFLLPSEKDFLLLSLIGLDEI